MNTSIFVSIANYRDSETAPTIYDLLEKAESPENIRIGVLSQIVLDLDNDCLAPNLPEVQQITIDARQSKGPCWARSFILTQLLKDETHVLQIDSHMRFVKNWDTMMLDMLSICPSPRSLLSCYPVAYTPPATLGDPLICYLKAKEFNQHGILVQCSNTIPYIKRPKYPIEQAFIAAGFLFGPREAYIEVPYDPYIYFHGEEITMAARLWTHGWNIYAPNDVLIYHDYTQNRKRPKHWDDHSDWPRLNANAVDRVKFLLSNETPRESESIREIEKFSLGNKRIIDDYQLFANIDFKKRELM